MAGPPERGLAAEAGKVLPEEQAELVRMAYFENQARGRRAQGAERPSGRLRKAPNVLTGNAPAGSARERAET
ncbi:hypothetical protein AAFN88_04240 [Pelagibius sp. CAU 1746]|uniref:hypothetical protein n=1 Tax=Pelagibius sp. CAU 1746 TaxID=3140370 RepID=UPI00325B39E0